MTLLWHSIWLSALILTARTDSTDSNGIKTGESVESSVSYESSLYSSSLPVSQSSSLSLNNAFNINNNNNPQSVPQTYSSSIQSGDNLDKKERKTLILAIPVKLSLPNGDQDNFESPLSGQTAAESSLTQSAPLYAGNPYLSYSQSSSSRYPESQNSDDSEPSAQKQAELPPLSQKIYPSLESQLKSMSYSTANTLNQKPFSDQQSSLSYNSNDYKYKPVDQVRDAKQLRTPSYNYRPNTRQEYKGLNNEGVDTMDGDYGSRKYSGIQSQPIKPYDDSYETKLRQKESAKQVYESLPDARPEYDYDSAGSSGSGEQEYEDIKSDDNYNIRTAPKKTPYLANNRKNQFSTRGYPQKQEAIAPYYYNRESSQPLSGQSLSGQQLSGQSLSGQPLSGQSLNGQQLPAFNAEPFDGWPNYYYKANTANTWPQIQEAMESQNLLNLYKGFTNKNTDSVRNGMYAPAYDLMADPLAKSPSNPVPMNMQNSKIYGPYTAAASTYQPINLFAGYGRDYSLVDMNGELYPAPLVAQTPPRKLHKTSKHTDLAEQASRDSVKLRRNPLLLRPSFMSGLRSVASKPLAYSSPFASASTTQSVLSSLPALPSLQNTFNMNRFQISRQLFPLLYKY